MSFFDWIRKLFGKKPPPPAPPSDLAAELLRLANLERTKAGLNPCRVDPGVQLATSRHGALMAQTNTLEHQLPGEPDVGQRLTAAGVRWTNYGEIIGAGQTTPAEMINDWLDSPGHRRILLGSLPLDGASVDRGSDSHLYWTMDFASTGALALTAERVQLPGGIDRR